MKESIEQSTRLLNEYRAEVTSLKLELESLMAGRTLGNTQNTEAEATAAQLELTFSEAMANLETESTVVQLEPTFSEAVANLETESTAVQLDLPISAAVANPEAGSEAEAGTAVSEGVIVFEKVQMQSVESIRANEDFSFVEDILAVIFENSTTLVDSDGSGGQDSREDTFSVNAHLSSRISEDEREPVCFLILCCLSFLILSLLSFNLLRHA